MASTISAGTTAGTAIVVSGDTSGSLALQTNGTTTAVTIDTSQNVGIGTTSPSTGVHLQKASGNTYYRAQNNLANVDFGVDGAGTGILWNNSNYPLAFGTNNTERMRIDSSGNVLVGTATNNSRNPRLALNGNSVTWAVGPNSSNSTFVVYNPSEAGVYLPSGNTAWVSTSDERLKNITGEITDAINKVSQLRAAEFTWKSDESNKPQVGLIAQDVQTVLPEAISENDKEFLGVSYTDVIPLLVASIKEQQTIINDLKARITALEGLSA